MERQEAEALILKYTEGNCTPDEKRLVDSYFLKYLQGAAQLPDLSQIEVHQQEIWNHLAQYIGEGEASADLHEMRKVTLWPRIRIAVGIAAAVATIVFGVWFFVYREVAPRNEDWAKNDVAPGKNGATITLSSGEVIALSGEKKGVVIGNGKISYSSLRGTNRADGELSEANQSSDEIASLPRNDGQGGNPQGLPMLTASTAKGQTYEFTLPDGTHVFLNADSKISFPSQFSGKERKILLKGEAYFAVVHNAKQPFRVESRGQVVEDIGTEFNINAYADEAVVKTTLVEGIAKVNTVILKPNQQASNKGGSIKVKTVNPEEATAWKNGVFIYDGTPLADVMRQLSRWYNVEVVYEKASLKAVTIGGAMSRYDKVSRILKTLENTGAVKFELKGRRITVKE